ncbi:MAG: transglutaminase domain-containing protein, partial [Bacteroidales bacterium]|nr:transglutaminase domain-containing protein [Bacteroidales bacterium]
MSLIISSMGLLSAQNDYWTAVRHDYQNRTDIPQYVREHVGFYNLKSAEESRNMYQYLMFLYAYMPMSDLADYDFEFFEDQVKVAMEARKTFSWGKTIPDDIFRHFVVVYRVNNENLDTARSYIFHQLKDRIKDMSMYDAALEVNHWCHEYVDYQPADARTSAPLATLKTSHGRCGEESTLTVTALRAVGIPARQCYTPRWAHCDDNHAWVEVWVDGKWWFLGACEPDPDLNMGWFAYPSTRTMMVHTNVFGRYEGPEEVNKKTKYYSCINVLSNYADTVHLTVTVVDDQNKPIKDALVRCKLYNYAEYYTL